VSRWTPDSRARLEAAALDLFEQRGYARVTAAEVAARAGVTERTFFRHFKDKREVLFPDDAVLERVLAGAVAAAPADATGVEAVAAGVRAMAEHLQGREDALRRRAAVVASHADLQERELAKLSALSAVLAAALRDRGVAGSPAELAGDVAIAVFRVAFARWTAPGASGAFAAHAEAALAETAAFFARGPVSGPGTRRPRRRAAASSAR